MVTTLFSGDNISNKSFYYGTTADGRTVYCEALMPAEAACKYMLATVPFDEIIVIGSDHLGPAEGIPGPISLRDSLPASTVSLNALTRYDLLRYRLTEYMDEVRAEAQDIDALISEEEEKEILAFIRGFFDEKLPDVQDKPSRYFHLLAQDTALLEALHEALRGAVPEADYDRYRTWVHHRLYQMLKDTFKMELLEQNGNVRIRFIPVREGEASAFLNRISTMISQSSGANGKNGTDLYICLQNSEATVTMGIMYFTNLVSIIPDSQVKVCKTLSLSYRRNALAERITDDTESQSVSALFSGMDAFLNNGKAKGIVDYWKQLNVNDPKGDSIVYALRNIDNGISLCDVNDIERGIRSLREALKDGTRIEGRAPLVQLFEVLLEAIRRDYGRLLETDKIEFIDLVRWAYRKEFWQQTLTLIESRAPQELIDKGFFYYCDSQDNREQVVRVFGQLYYDLRPFEKYRLDEVSHYYIKYYSRQKANQKLHGKEYIQSYTRVRIAELDNTDPNEIRACTVCPDRDALEDLLFAYYYIGDVRNQTNHAAETYDGFYDIMADSDSGERMDLIQQSIDYFLHCYDRVTQLSKGQTPNVIQVSNTEITQYAEQLRQQYRNRER